MSKKDQLREQHSGMVLNLKSKNEDKQCGQVVEKVAQELAKKYNIFIKIQSNLQLVDILARLESIYQGQTFTSLESEKSNIRPDGGIVSLVDKNDNIYPILVAEVKNQGTNDKRQQEGKSKQSLGNAVERLGKNVIALRAFMQNEDIFSFVCFGDGCDFEKGSTILDRVKAIALFGTLNEDHTINEGPNGVFNRGSYYFRNKDWAYQEMYNIMLDIAEKAIKYYIGKYGRDNFI